MFQIPQVQERESAKDMKRRQKEEGAYRTQLGQLAKLEQQRTLLHRVRVEMETLRLLLDQTHKREKLKRQGEPVSDAS